MMVHFQAMRFVGF
jgi:hypothetical protein